VLLHLELKNHDTVDTNNKLYKFDCKAVKVHLEQQIQHEAIHITKNRTEEKKSVPFLSYASFVGIILCQNNSSCHYRISQRGSRFQNRKLFCTIIQD